MLHSELKSKINKLWNRFWSGGISNPLQAIEQISYLIFMKRLEDKDVQRQQEALLSGKTYKSLFEGHEDCRWSVWSQYSAEKILDHARDKVFPFIRSLENKSEFASYLKNANFEIPTASLLIEAVDIINDLHIKEQNQDVQGDIYEFLLSELQTAGKNGQFRTPRHIVKMMVELTKPELRDRILDPACGTAGFLVGAYEYVLKTNTSKDLLKKDEEGNIYNLKGDLLSDEQKKLLDEDTLYGNEIDPTMVRISVMNLLMHGISKPNIKQENTLSKKYNEENTYDLILANPPFKGSIDESEMSDTLTLKTKKTEILFLELIYNSLIIGGRTAVIVPDGVLSNKTTKAYTSIRKQIMEKCRLDAIITMPSGVFKPYAGVQTAVLFFTKGEPTEKVWFYNMESDGYSLDDKRIKIETNDLPDILERFEKRNKEQNDDRTKKHFFVTAQEIAKKGYDFSFSTYSKQEYVPPKFENPKIIKEKLVKLEEEIFSGLEKM